MERLKTKFVKLEHNQIRLFKESEQQKKRKGHLQIIIANLAQSSTEMLCTTNISWKKN